MHTTRPTTLRVSSCAQMWLRERCSRHSFVVVNRYSIDRGDRTCERDMIDSFISLAVGVQAGTKTGGGLAQQGSSASHSFEVCKDMRGSCVGGRCVVLCGSVHEALCVRGGRARATTKTACREERGCVTTVIDNKASSSSLLTRHHRCRASSWTSFCWASRAQLPQPSASSTHCNGVLSEEEREKEEGSRVTNMES